MGKSWQHWLVFLAILDKTRSFTSPYAVKNTLRSLPWSTLSFDSTPTGRQPSSPSCLSALQNIELILLDLPFDNRRDDASFLLPLPSDHLPRELSTTSVYGIQLTVPLHQLIVQQAKEEHRGIFGQVAYKPTPQQAANEEDEASNCWVGAIGCAAQVLMLDKGEAVDDDDKDETKSVDADESKPHTVLIQGKWRFVVREVKSTIPYPVVLVDELLDEDDPAVQAAAVDDDQDSLYANLKPEELVERLLDALKTHAKQQLVALESNQDISPLEQSLAEGIVDLSMQRAAEKRAAEEMAAIVDVVALSLKDICPAPLEQYYCIGFLAAELAGVSNALRKDCLVMTNAVARMRLVLRNLEEQIGRQQAMSLTELITKRVDNDEKDLKVGEPTLPAWARQIQKGMRLEYYWNEEWDWCVGEVVEDPLFVVDEVILTVYFPMDGSTHRLPITAEEKVRWRPLR